MSITLLQNKQKKLHEKSDFYTPSGLHVYYKEPITNEDVDAESVIAKVEAALPDHLRMGVEMIIFGHFDEFDERSINAFYDSGTLYISNVQEDDADLYDDIVHEYSHSLEEQYGYEIYADQKLKDEFLRKRKHLHDILWKSGYKVPLSTYVNTELDPEFDKFLHQKVGYDKLSSLLMGLFISPYAATSLREYFATGFTDFYLYPDHNALSKVSPELYRKLIMLQKPETLDNP
jgi:cobalamin biosynthesis Mg chelatase CobN